MTDKQAIQHQAEQILQLQRHLQAVEHALPPECLVGCASLDRGVDVVVSLLKERTATLLELQIKTCLGLDVANFNELIDIDNVLGVSKQLCGSRLAAIREIDKNREAYREASIALQKKLEEAENVIDEVTADRDSWKALVDSNRRFYVDQIHDQQIKYEAEILQLKRDKENTASAMASNSVDPDKYNKLRAEVAHLRSANKSLEKNVKYWEGEYNTFRNNVQERNAGCSEKDGIRLREQARQLEELRSSNTEYRRQSCEASSVNQELKKRIEVLVADVVGMSSEATNWRKHYNDQRLHEAALGIERNEWKVRFEIEQGKNAGRAQHEEMLRRKRDEADTKYKAQCQTIVNLEKKLAHWNKVAGKISGLVNSGELDGPEETPKLRKFRQPGGFYDNTDYVAFYGDGSCDVVLKNGCKLNGYTCLEYALANWEEIV